MLRDAILSVSCDFIGLLKGVLATGFGTRRGVSPLEGLGLAAELVFGPPPAGWFGNP